MKIGTTINLLLAALWALAAIAAFIAFSFYTRAGWVASLDTAIKHHYVQEVRDRSQLVTARFQSNHDLHAHIADLDSLMDSLTDIQKGSALESTKRFTFAELVWANQQVGDLSTAMHWVTRWIAFDPRDLQAQTEQARLYMLVPGTRAKGEKLFDQLAHQFPESLSVADARATAYAQSGQVGQAFLRYIPFLPGHRQDPLFPVIGSAMDSTVDVHLENARGEFVVGETNWTNDGPLWLLTIDAAPAFDAISLRPPVDLSVDTNLIYVRGNGKELKPDIVASGLDAQGDGWRKQAQRYGELRISGLAGASLPVTVLLKTVVAPTRTLTRLYLPNVAPIVEQQLGAMNQPAALAAYKQYAQTIH